jgi:hypothetical protein
MPKLDREAGLKAGEELLGSWQIPSDATVDAYEAVLGRDAEADLAIAARLGAIADPRSAEMLRRLETSADKRLRKEAKRSLYRLEQRGVCLPKEAPPAPRPPSGAQLEGLLSPVDGRGDQLVWLIKPRPGGVLHLFSIINDPEGMRESDLVVVTRKALRAMRAELAAKNQIELVEADWQYCDFLMHRAFEWARGRGTRISGDYPAMRTQLVKEPAAAELPPLIFSRVDADALEKDEVRLQESGSILEEPEFQTWFRTREELQPYLDELDAVRDSPLVLDQAQQDERLRAVIERAVEELFSGEQRQSWVRRTLAMAYVFWMTKRQEQARRAAVAALALSRSARGGRDIAFYEVLVRMSLAGHFQATVEQEAERNKSSLILTPQQIRSQQQRRR